MIRRTSDTTILVVYVLTGRMAELTILPRLWVFRAYHTFHWDGIYNMVSVKGAKDPVNVCFSEGSAIGSGGFICHLQTMDAVMSDRAYRMVKASTNLDI